ncbi:MAG: universal stress protein [Nitrospirota bacterium]
MKIEKILFPTKFRELAFHSLESLLVLKEVGLKEVVLYYVIPREEIGFVPYGGYLKQEEERIREEARIRFEDWQKSLSAKGIDSKIIIEVGEPVPNILKIAEKEMVNLIIIGKKKKIGHEGHFIGSRTLQVITRSKIPTLVSKYMVQFERDGEVVTQINKDVFKRPILTTDWSEPSERALNLLISLNGLVEKAFVCHTIGVKIAKAIDKSELHRIEKESKERLEKYCERLKSAGIPAEPHLGAGRTILEIIRISRDVKASMIIMGTTGKDRIHELFLGSVSHRVAGMSELPTLLVP